MPCRPTIEGAALLALVPLLGVSMLTMRSPSSTAATCPSAYFEIQPSPAARVNQGWEIPAGGTWTEIHPVFGEPHPQYVFEDYDHDGLIDKDESFSEQPGGTPWFVAEAGTMYHLTPVELGSGGTVIPVGDPFVAWWRRCWASGRIRSDNRFWFDVPDTLIVLNPACCDRLGIVSSIAGGVVGNNSPNLLAIAGPGEYELLWFRVDDKTCGLWVAPSLATPATSRSWGDVKTRSR